MTGAAADIRGGRQDDLDFVLELNNRNQPAVSELDMPALERLVEWAQRFWMVEVAGERAGFCLILGPGKPYTSLNYRWVSERHPRFEYLDRVVIGEQFRGRGIGRLLYTQWFAESAAGVPLLLEVNVRPRNEPSLRFHGKLGFHAVGEQDTEGGAKRVCYLTRPGGA